MNSCVVALWGGPKLAKEDFVYVWVVVPFDKVWVIVENVFGNLFLVLFLDVYIQVLYEFVGGVLGKMDYKVF